MKKIIFAIGVLILSLSVVGQPANGQIGGLLIEVNDSSCFSDGGCEVVVRQYTGLINRYRISIRCMDSGGNFGSWEVWEYDGISNGSYCN